MYAHIYDKVILTELHPMNPLNSLCLKSSKLSAFLQHYSLAANWSLTPPMEVLTFLHSTSSLPHNSVESFLVMSTPCALFPIELASFLLKYYPHQNLLYSYGTKAFCFANIFAYFT